MRTSRSRDTRRRKRTRSGRVLTGCALLVPLCGCAITPRSDIEGEDETFFGSARASFPLGDGADDDPEASRVGVRVEVEAAGGDFVQALGAGEVVQLDEVAFTGPGNVAIDFDHVFASVGLYFGRDYGRFELEGLLGLGGSFLDADAAMGALTDSADVDSIGMQLGGTASFRVADPLALFYELRLFQGWTDADVTIVNVQLGAAWTVTEHVELSAGYQDWDYSGERDTGVPEPSDLELGLEGVFARLHFTL